MRSHTRQSTSQRMLAVVLLLAAVYMATAQELEYKMELGAMAGVGSYMGDANNTEPFKNAQMAGSILARYNFNPRMVVKGNLAIGRMKGTTAGMDNRFPDNAHTVFNRSLYDLGAQFEYNFFAYGTGAGYKDSHRFTPYILLGIGLTYSPQPHNHVFAFNTPIGIGAKYKLAERLNCGVEWTMRLTTTDRLDTTGKTAFQLNDPYQIKGKGMKNKDCYSFLVLYISYDLFPKYRKCNN